MVVCFRAKHLNSIQTGGGVCVLCKMACNILFQLSLSSTRFSDVQNKISCRTIYRPEFLFYRMEYFFGKKTTVALM